MTREEFIAEHWDEALAIDAKMREAAKACVKHFLGEDQDIPVMISRELWSKRECAIDYFVLLAYVYSIRALDQRVLKSRSFIETLFQLLVLQSAIGNECVTVVARNDYATLSIPKAFLGNKASGDNRRQSGIELVRMHNSMFGGLPSTYEEMNKNGKLFPRKSVAGVWAELWRKSKTKEQREECKVKEAEEIQSEVARICDVWNLNRESSMDTVGWMLT